MSSSGESYTATTQEEAIIKAMIKLCKPCCRKHGNPGCCGEVYTCDGYLRIDLSYMVDGCSSDCAEAEGYAINIGSAPEPCPPYSASDNWDSANYCDDVADAPGANGAGPECAGGWLGDGGSSGNVKTVSDNYDPMGGGWIDKTMDACYSGCGFTCYDDASGSSDPPCEARWFFCATYNYYQGMANGPPWPSLEGLGCVTHPGLNPFYIRIDGGDIVYYPGAVNPPVEYKYPFILSQYHQDVLDFEHAECDPFIMDVKDLEPWLTLRQDGVRGIGVVTCYTDVEGNEAYIFEYETIPLANCDPTFNATFTIKCLPCVVPD
jgi:hypothetical protein